MPAARVLLDVEVEPLALNLQHLGGELLLPALGLALHSLLLDPLLSSPFPGPLGQN